MLKRTLGSRKGLCSASHAFIVPSRKRGYIFSLDMLFATYLTIISLVVVTASLEVLSQMNFDDYQLYKASRDKQEINYYRAPCDATKYLGLGTNCFNSRTSTPTFYATYSNIYTTQPTLWFGGRVTTTAEEACFEGY